MTGPPERLLYLCQNLPYPPDEGALIRSFHTLRLLSASFEVTALHFYRSAPDGEAGKIQAAVDELSRFGSVRAFRVPQDGSRARWAWDHLRSIATRRVYTRWMYESADCIKALEEAAASGRFDLVHVESLDLSALLDHVPDAPIVIAHHNVESQLLERRGRAEGRLRGLYMQHQARLMRREERRYCPGVELNLVCSLEDQRALESVAPGAKCVVVPNGVDTSALRPQPSGRKKGLVFVGGYSWFPNRDGMRYFVDEILPTIRRERPDVEVTWVGRVPAPACADFESHGVKMTGYVEDIATYVHPAACFVVPLRVGGGTRLKILDAWALGKAVVSTSAGCEGLEVLDGKNMLVANDAASFADAVLRVLADDDLRKGLEREGRETAVRRYDWDAIGRTLHAAYAEIVRKP